MPTTPAYPVLPPHDVVVFSTCTSGEYHPGVLYQGDSVEPHSKDSKTYSTPPTGYEVTWDNGSFPLSPYNLYSHHPPLKSLGKLL